MAVRIRLQRHGKKGAPFYHIIATDKRAPRNGRFIERIGSYNPLTQPATIDIDVDKAVAWLQDGATASETAHAILKYKGVVYKNHLLNGVKKGAFKAEDVEAKFQSWIDGKTAKIGGHEDKIKKAKSDAKTARLDAEKLVSDNRQKANDEAAKLAEAEANKVETTEEATTENADAPAAETTENPEA
jgi:small subunit ribosomal protein S16